MRDSMQRDESSELKRELEEAKHTISQLTQQLGIMEHLLQQERNARVSAEFAAQQAASAAEVAARAAVEANQHRAASVFTDQERVACESAGCAVIESRREDSPHSKGDNDFRRSKSEDFDMEDVSNALAVDGASLQVSKKSRESTNASELRELNKPRSSPPAEGKTLSLAEARKAAQEEMERRIQERTKSLSSKK